MILPPLLYQGSVKEVRGVRGESPWYFEFSDRFSVFDWGKMPDSLEKKGIAQAQFSRLLFQYLAKKTGVKTTFLGMAEKNIMKIKPVHIKRPCKKKNGDWDYAAYKDHLQNTLIPLEVVFRFGVPSGSSFLKRANLAYCRSLGLKRIPKEGDLFDFVIIEFSSKLEDKDRYMNYEEAKEIAGLSSLEFKRLFQVAKQLAEVLCDFFLSSHLQLWDGKFEFAFGRSIGGERELWLADSIGPDELRLTFADKPLSKEAIRYFYRQDPWYRYMEQAKKMSKKRGEKNWQSICREDLRQVPPSLPKEKKQIYSMIYQSLANAVAFNMGEKIIFSDAWSLSRLSDRLCMGEAI